MELDPSNIDGLSLESLAQSRGGAKSPGELCVLAALREARAARRFGLDGPASMRDWLARIGVLARIFVEALPAIIAAEYVVPAGMRRAWAVRSDGHGVARHGAGRGGPGGRRRGKRTRRRRA